MVLRKLKNEIKLFKRHIQVLRILKNKGPLGIIKLSNITKISPSQIRYSLRVLQQSNFLQPTTKGAKINKNAEGFLENFDLDKKRLVKELSEF